MKNKILIVVNEHRCYAIVIPLLKIKEKYIWFSVRDKNVECSIDDMYSSLRLLFDKFYNSNNKKFIPFEDNPQLIWFSLS